MSRGGGDCALCPLLEGGSHGSLCVDSSRLGLTLLPRLVPGIRLRGEDSSMLSPWILLESRRACGWCWGPLTVTQIHPLQPSNPTPSVQPKETCQCVSRDKQEGIHSPGKDARHRWSAGKRTPKPRDLTHSPTMASSRKPESDARDVKDSQGNVLNAMGTAVCRVRGAGGVAGGHFLRV